MRFQELPIDGAYLIELQPIHDRRGFNARAWSAQEYEAHGLVNRIVESNVIFNRAKATLRGMHYQVPPMAEAKSFRVTHGAIYDVIVDIRQDSPTHMEWTSVELAEDTPRMLYVPEGVAQGFMTLEDNTEVTYHVSASYSPGHGRGFRYDDPAFGIRWPLEPRVMSDKDRDWPGFSSG
jgi:dTDP-4-dehydrorhamnose 3,5-epimerase